MHAQPHATLNTIETRPAPLCHPPKNNSFGGFRHYGCSVTITWQHFDQAEQRHAVILGYRTSLLKVYLAGVQLAESL